MPSMNSAAAVTAGRRASAAKPQRSVSPAGCMEGQENNDKHPGKEQESMREARSRQRKLPHGRELFGNPMSQSDKKLRPVLMHALEQRLLFAAAPTDLLTKAVRQELLDHWA